MIEVGRLYELDDNTLKCLSFNGTLGKFQLLNEDGSNYYNWDGYNHDYGIRIIMLRISELKKKPQKCALIRGIWSQQKTYAGTLIFREAK